MAEASRVAKRHSTKTDHCRKSFSEDVRGRCTSMPFNSEARLGQWASEADKKECVDLVRQGAKMQEKVSRRAIERLEIAEARHKRVLAGLEAQHEMEAQRILKDTDRREVEVQGLEFAAKTSIDRIQAQTYEREDTHACHAASRLKALDQVDLARSQGASNTAAVEAQMSNAQQEAEASIAKSQDNARTHLSELSRIRAEIQTKMAKDCRSREAQCDAVKKELDVRSHNEMVRADITRHRAKMAMDIAGGRGQEMRTESHARVLKNEAKAGEHVSKLNEDRQTMQSQVDCVLKEKLKDSALSLEAAHEYCQDMRRLMDNESTQFQRRIREIELGSDMNCREKDRKVHNLEKDRLHEFMEAQVSVNHSENWLRSKRAESDAEVEEIHRRLLEVEGHCKQRADQIRAQWLASSEAAEQAVKGMEAKGREIMAEFKDMVERKLKDFLEQDAAVKQSGSANVADLERQATTVIECTQSELEKARREDERAAAAAVAQWQEAKKVPEEIGRKADEEIAAKEKQAQDEEAELRRQAEVRIAAAKAATKAAHQEELWLQAQTAETWSRLRKASFELKKASLHDLAQSTLAGDYDAQMDDIVDFVKL